MWSAATLLLGVLLRGVSYGNWATNTSAMERIKRDKNDVRAVGKILLHTMLPWCKQLEARLISRYYFDYDPTDEIEPVVEPWDSELTLVGLL